MAKLGAKALLIGTAVSYLYCLLALHACLFATLGDASAAFLRTVLASAALPTAAYGVGSMLAGGGAGTQAFLFVSAIAFHGIAMILVAELGFFAALSYTMLGSGVVMVAKLSDGTDARFHIGKYVFGFLFCGGFTDLMLARDFGSASCFFAVAVLLGIVYCSDLEAPTPGSLHALLATDPRQKNIGIVFSGEIQNLPAKETT